MAGGPSIPELVAAVANGGGVGSFGFAYHHPDKIKSDLRVARNLTNGPINANFFVFSLVEMPSLEICRAALQVLSALPGAKDIQIKLPQPPFYPNLYDQLEAIWQEPPEILTFHFGLPNKAVIAKAHELGITIGINATQVAEAEEIANIGADFIVVQGIEAGGHRGIFDPDGLDEKLSTLDLVRAIKSVISLPVVAAGGIMNGRQIKDALDAGAIAVQMGTAFLTCVESGASAAHRRLLLGEHQRSAELTKAYSGRPARGIATEFMQLMRDKTILPFPIQNSVTSAIRKAAVERDDGEYQSLWAGTNYVLCKDENVAELMQRLEQELRAT